MQTETTRDQAGEDQRDAKGQNDRPRRGRGQLHQSPVNVAALRCELMYQATTFLALFLTPDDVNDREHHDPHRVHEMPVEAKHIDVRACSCLTFRAKLKAKTVRSPIRPTVTWNPCRPTSE